MIWSRKKGETLSFIVEGMRCAHCEATIKIALHSVPGVQRVEIRRRKIVRVEVDPGQPIPRAELLAAINRTGYQASELADGD
jgi:copper chaperone CopZ